MGRWWVPHPGRKTLNPSQYWGSQRAHRDSREDCRSIPHAPFFLSPQKPPRWPWHQRLLYGLLLGRRPQSCSALCPTSTLPRAWRWSGSFGVAQRVAFRRLRARGGSRPWDITQMALWASTHICSRPRSPVSSMGPAMPAGSTTPACLPWGAALRSPSRWLVRAWKTEKWGGGGGCTWEFQTHSLAPFACQVSLAPLWRMASASSCLPSSSLGSWRHWAGPVSVSPTQTGTLERQGIICLLPEVWHSSLCLTAPPSHLFSISLHSCLPDHTEFNGKGNNTPLSFIFPFSFYPLSPTPHPRGRLLAWWAECSLGIHTDLH